MSKRVAEKELTDRNWDQEEETEEVGTFSVASEEVLKNRAIKKAKRRNVGFESESGGAFKGFKGFILPSGTGGFSGFGNDTGTKPLGGLSNGSSSVTNNSSFTTLKTAAETQSTFSKPFNITLVQLYAPTIGAEEAEVDWFCEGLQHLLELTPKNDVLIIMGDWSAKVGSQKITGITGKFNLGVQNEAGHRLVEFHQVNTMVIADMLFQQLKGRLYTWTSPDGQHRNQIDYVLCSQRGRSSIQLVKSRPGADCGSDHELLVAKCRLQLKQVGKSTRPLRYDLNHIPDEYTVEVRNRFKEFDLIDRVPEELWMEVCNIVQEVATKTVPKKKKCKKAKWLSQEALQLAEERREVKGKGEKERYTQLNAEFQRIARRDKNAFLNEQCKEIEENNRIGRTRDLFKKIGDTKGTFHAKMGMIKDQNGRDLTEAEEIKKRWQDYTEELYKKDLNVPDNHDGVVTDLKPDILEREVKWA
ncbi:Craniofacial development protein 2 [Varanus komodoensis]|nr:Craniofacial development protein 2 [Varanus komodoensis]